MNFVFRFCVMLELISFGFGFKTNITQFGNCNGVLQPDEEYPVEVFNIEYESEDGFVNSLHGKYKVRAIDTREKELVITIFQCPQTTKGQCNSNGKSFIEAVHCDQFKRDNTGIWYMISSAMTGSHCGETAGIYDLEGVTLRTEYLTKYISNNPVPGRYHLRMHFHKKSEEVSDIHVRACIRIEFDVL